MVLRVSSLRIMQFQLTKTNGVPKNRCTMEIGDDDDRMNDQIRINPVACKII